MIHAETAVRAGKLFDQARRDGLNVPAAIVFGAGRIGEVGAVAAGVTGGRKALLVFGGRSAARSGLSDRVAASLAERGFAVEVFAGVDREPTAQMVNAAAATVRRARPDLVVSLGGGSVMDCAKAAAALATNDGCVEDYLEGVGRGCRVAVPPIPHLAAPTVAGTGAEMTKNAVIGCPERRCKRSMRAESMTPAAALVDPRLTLTVPPGITAAGGMDAITQLIEPCITAKRRPETTALALEALRGVREALLACFHEPANLPAREQMSLASSISGCCLANAGLAMAHGVAAALGAVRDIAHGLACGMLLPHALRYNRDACPAELGAALAAFLGRAQAGERTIDDGIASIADLNRRLGVPPDLRHLRLTPAELRELAGTSGGTSMSGNPVPMTPDRTLEFLRSISC